MSWQPYVNDHLLKDGFCIGGIVGQGGETWASSSRFNVDRREVKRIAAALEGDKESMHRLVTKGFMVAGKRFALTKADADNDEVQYLIGRAKTTGEESEGIVIARTHKALVVGIHNPIYADGTSFGKSAVKMHQLAEYIMSMQF